MRKMLFSMIAAASAFGVASPAAAQWAQPRPAYAYGYGNNMGRWQREIQQLRFQMDRLGRSGRLTRREAIDLQNDIRSAERVVYRNGRGGIAPWEARQIDEKIARVRYELRRYSDYDRRDDRWRRY